MKKRVLIVEDESIIALSLKAKLQNFGFNVIDIVDNAEEAIEIAQNEKPDLVLMDIRLSGELDGIDAALKIREVGDVPSIFLTAYVDDKTLKRAKLALPVGYLQKPFDDADLKSAIEVGLFKEEVQKELVIKERKLRMAHHIAKLSHWEWDVKKNRGDFSDNGYNMLKIPEGYFSDSKFLENLIDLIYPLDQENFLEDFNSKIFNNKDFRTEFRILVEGNIKHFYLIAKVQERFENQPSIVTGILQDVTNRKELELRLLAKERQLQESQKLEALGRIAGVIAHDFNNYLTLMMGNLQLLKKASDPQMKYYEQYNVLLDTIKFASSLTNQLLTFSKKKVVKPEILDLNSQILDISELLKVLAKDHNFVINLDATHPYILAEGSQLQQILMNLVTNSVEAMHNPGTIQITTSNLFLDSNNQIELPQGDYVKLNVIDNGIGMTDETKKHVFEPFYTTDKTGKHSGIGLSTVYGLVKQFGGEIILSDNLEGTGTDFSLYFPTHKKLEDTLQDKKVERSLDSNIKSILVIEDNDEILNLIKTILMEDSSFMVETVSDGGSAWGLIDEQKKFDLIITDILLPGMSGTEIIEKVKGINTDQKFLLISGFVDSFQVQNLLSDTVKFLPKPFMIEELISKIEEFFT